MMKGFNVKRIMMFFLLFFAVVVNGAGAADDSSPQTPTSLRGGKVISLEETKSLLEKKDVHFFDMRSAINYGKGHLPGAVALPYQQRSEKVENFDPSVDVVDFSRIPADKNALIVFYSDGPGGWKSYKAAVLAIRRGYTNIHWFRGGTAEWEKSGSPMEH